MHASTRRLVVAAIAASAMLACPFAGITRPLSPWAPRCHRLYGMREAIRYARRIYAGTRTTRIGEMKRLGRLERCQHNRHARRYAHHRARELRHAHRLRVDRANSHPWSTSVVSWYDDSGQTASGYHATYGVADCGTDGVCYPFGTRIEFCLSGCVVATVDDHGPYIAGRDYDLNQNTAQAIGFSGVGTVRWRLQ